MVRFSPFGSTRLEDLTEKDLDGVVAAELPEGLFIEYKRDWTPDKVARAVSSFANSPGGGTVIVGVRADDLIPKEVCGASFPADPSETTEQVIRSNIDPIPNYQLVAIPLSNGTHAVVIEVPEGTLPPYIWVKKGQILVRSNTNSEPMRATDREAIDRLFYRGERGINWAQGELEKVVTPVMKPNRGSIWTVPAVEKGLSQEHLVFRTSFLEEIEKRMPVPFQHAFTDSKYETPSEGGRVIRVQPGIYAAVSAVKTDGTVTSQWTTFTTKGAPEPVPEPFTMDKLESLITQALPFHRHVTEDLLGHRGYVAVGISASLLTMAGQVQVRVAKRPIPVQYLDEKAFVQFVIREASRAGGAPVPEPELP